jgi:serine/threonine protein kinase
MAVSMLEIIEMFHNKTMYLHRDIKPPNFRVHQGKLFITDFGLVTEYIKDGSHIPEAKNEPIQGTLKYASHWTHEGIAQSRRDDIEMIAYSILKLLGDNPKDELWPSIEIGPNFSTLELSAKFYNEKRNFINENKPRYRQVIEFIKENNKCHFAQQPNYSGLKFIL